MCITDEDEARVQNRPGRVALSNPYPPSNRHVVEMNGFQGTLYLPAICVDVEGTGWDFDENGSVTED